MLGAVLIGGVAAIVVSLPRYLHAYFPQIAWSASFMILLIGLLGALGQRRLQKDTEGSLFDGLAELWIRIQSPADGLSELAWIFRGLISFLLAVFAGIIGPEGAAIEFSQAVALQMRSKSAFWLEEMRRTFVGASIAGAVSAAFGTPFAAIILVLELRLGGKMLFAAISAVTAFLLSRALGSVSQVQGAFGDWGDFKTIFAAFEMRWENWLGVLLIGILCGVLGIFMLQFIRFTRVSLSSLFQRRLWMRMMTGALVVTLLYSIYSPVHFPPWVQLEQLLWERQPVVQGLALFGAEIIAVTLIISSFGTTGVFWSLFLLGGIGGYLLSITLLSGASFTPAATLIGASALWSVFFGTPWAAAILSYELSQSLELVLPCLVAGGLAYFVRRFFGIPDFIHGILKERGFDLVGGRSQMILDSIPIQKAMIRDFECVSENAPLSEVYERMSRADYPCMPVVNESRLYQGVLTLDLVLKEWEKQKQIRSSERLGKLLVAKDLLYKSGFQIPTLDVQDKLSQASKLFPEYPCVVVLDENLHVEGLLFIHNVRFVYDQESAKRSFYYNASKLGSDD